MVLLLETRFECLFIRSSSISMLYIQSNEWHVHSVILNCEEANEYTYLGPIHVAVKNFFIRFFVEQ